MQISSFIG